MTILTILSTKNHKFRFQLYCK